MPGGLPTRMFPVRDAPLASPLLRGSSPDPSRFRLIPSAGEPRGEPSVSRFIVPRFAGGTETRAFHTNYFSYFPMRVGRTAQGTAFAHRVIDEPLLVHTSWAGGGEGVPSVSAWVGSKA